MTTDPISPAGLADSTACAPGHLQFGAPLRRSGASVYRKTYASASKAQIPSTSSAAGFLLGVSMTDSHRRKVVRGELSGSHFFSKGDVYLRDLQDPYVAEVDAPFDFALFEFSRTYFDALIDGDIETSTVALSPVAARHDPVLPHLAHAILPLLTQPEQACPLFMDQIFSAMAAYLMHAFGGFVPTQSQAGVLSKVHVDRAKELLLSKVRGELSIQDIARECNMSASYFMKAFKKTLGKTPHQWLLCQRLALAQQYLRNSTLSLAEVASTCHFYDQSHFSRVFTQNMGVPPGVWRRQAA